MPGVKAFAAPAVTVGRPFTRTHGMLRSGRGGWAGGFLLVFAMGMQASAATVAPIRWYCGFGDGVLDVLQCAEDTDPAFIDVVLESWSGLPHTYHAEFFSLGSVARLVRQRPQVYDGRNWSVPLLGPALDAGRL
jgi:hypothetical protein